MKLVLLTCAVLVCQARRARQEVESPDSKVVVDALTSNRSHALEGLLMLVNAPMRPQIQAPRMKDAVMSRSRGGMRDRDMFRKRRRSNTGRDGATYGQYDYNDRYEYGGYRQPSHWSDGYGSQRQRHFNTINDRLGTDLGFNMDSLADSPRRSNRGLLKAMDDMEGKGDTGGFGSRMMLRAARTLDRDEFGTRPRGGRSRLKGRGMIIPSANKRNRFDMERQYDPYDYGDNSWQRDNRGSRRERRGGLRRGLDQSRGDWRDEELTYMDDYRGRQDFDQMRRSSRQGDNWRRGRDQGREIRRYNDQPQRFSSSYEDSNSLYADRLDDLRREWEDSVSYDRPMPASRGLRSAPKGLRSAKPWDDVEGGKSAPRIAKEKLNGFVKNVKNALDLADAATEPNRFDSNRYY